MMVRTDRIALVVFLTVAVAGAIWYGFLQVQSDLPDLALAQDGQRTRRQAEELVLRFPDALHGKTR
jgi:hypothetical protein